MPDRWLLRKIRQVVLENADGELFSLYVIGSFLSREMIESSDIDLVGVMKSSFDFRKEARINKTLNEVIGSSHSPHSISFGEFRNRTPFDFSLSYSARILSVRKVMPVGPGSTL
jgi:hypothetical protein